MKWVILLVLVLFISGCTDLESFIEKSGLRKTSTITFIDEVDAINAGYYGNPGCDEKLIRRHYFEDGSYEEICLDPEVLGLKRCISYDDCSDIEECKKGFCELVHSLVIDETT